MNRWLLLFLCLVAVYSVAVSGSWFTRKGLGRWYKDLKKPACNPSSKVFMLVWPILYTLMALALWLALAQSPEKVLLILLSFGLQLLFNFLWSFFFFTLKSPLLALIDLVLLFVALLWTIAVLYSISKLATIFLLPYLIWVLFAGYLNSAILYKNR